MEQSAKRLTILVNNDELAAIDNFRFENRIRNRSDAVRALLKLALDRGPTKGPRSLMMRTRAKKKC
jgi:metal-responsive CopG/Arc/MetJ family transcriptional regulator